jgi:hypothetical protein
VPRGAPCAQDATNVNHIGSAVSAITTMLDRCCHRNLAAQLAEHFKSATGRSVGAFSVFSTLWDPFLRPLEQYNGDAHCLEVVFFTAREDNDTGTASYSNSCSRVTTSRNPYQHYIGLLCICGRYTVNICRSIEWCEPHLSPKCLLKQALLASRRRKHQPLSRTAATVKRRRR